MSLGPSCDVGAPPGGPPLDRGEDTAADDEGADVGSVVIYGALEVVHPAEPLDGANHPVRHLFVLHSHHAQAHGAKQGFNDYISEPTECLHRLVRVLTDHCLRGENPTPFQQSGGPELVHGALDGPRRIDHSGAPLFQPVQRVHPEDDLFERTGGDDPGQHQIGLIQLRCFTAEPRAIPDPGDQSFVGNHDSPVASCHRRPLQLLRVPAGAGGEDSDQHYLVSTPIRASKPPVANLGRSPATFLKAGVATPFFRASREEKYSSA